jgi:hypothetical protein
MKIDAASLRIADVVRVPGGEGEITKLDRDPEDPTRVRAWLRGYDEGWSPRTEKEEDEGPPHAIEWAQDEVLEVQRPGDLFPEGEQAQTSSEPERQPLPRREHEAAAFLRKRLARERWIYQGPTLQSKREFMTDPTDTVRLQLVPQLELQSRIELGMVRRWRDVYRWDSEIRARLEEDAELGIQKLLEYTAAQVAERAKIDAREIERMPKAEVATGGTVVVRYARDSGVLVCGDTRSHEPKLDKLRSPYRLKRSFVLPSGCRYYAPRTRGTVQPRDRVELLVTALQRLGIRAALEFDDPGEAATSEAGSEAAGESVDPAKRLEVLVDQSGVLAERKPGNPVLLGALRAAERERLGDDMRAYLVRAGKVEPASGTSLLARIRSENALAANTWPPKPERGVTYSEAEHEGILDALVLAPEIAAVLDAAKRWPEALAKVAGERGKFWYRDLDLERLPAQTFSTNVSDQVAKHRRSRGASTATPKDAVEGRSTIAGRLDWWRLAIETSLDPRIYDPKSDPNWVAVQLCNYNQHVAKDVLEEVHGVPFADRRDAGVLCRGETSIDHLFNKHADAEVVSARQGFDSALQAVGEAQALLEIFDGLGEPLTIRRFNLAYWRAHPKLTEFVRDQVRMRAQHFPGIRAKDGIAPAGSKTELYVRGPAQRGFGVSSTSGDERELMMRMRAELAEVAGGRDLDDARGRISVADGLPRRSVKPLRSPTLLRRELALREAADKARSETLAGALRGAAEVTGATGFAYVDKIESAGDVEFFEAELAECRGEIDEAKFRAFPVTRGALEGILAFTVDHAVDEVHRKRIQALVDRSEPDAMLLLERDDLASALELGKMVADYGGGIRGSFQGARVRRAKMQRLGIVDTPTLRAALREYVGCCRSRKVEPRASTSASTSTSASAAGKSDKRAEKLRAAADKISEAANAALAVDRKANTHRRVEAAAHAVLTAQHDLEIAEAMRKAADASDPQRFPFVSRIESRQDVEYFDHEVREAVKRWSTQAGPDRDPSTPRELRLEAAKIEPLKLSRGGIENLQKSVSPSATAKQRKLIERIAERDSVVFSDAELEQLDALLDKSSKTAVATIIRRHAESQRRRARLGIHDDASLRAALREYYRVCRAGVVTPKSDPISLAKQAVLLERPPGFFPTPRALAERLVELAEIRPGMRVLEPSAGFGSIAEVIRERHGDATLEVVEKHSRLRELLASQGFTVVGDDVFQLDPERRYDRIIMNPPFEKSADALHVERAYQQLAPGGRLVAIASGSFPTRSEPSSNRVRGLIRDREGSIEPLPEGSFGESGTNVSTVLIIVEAPLKNRPYWAHKAMTDDEVASAIALNAVKAKWRAFEKSRPVELGAWPGVGKTACMQPIPGSLEITVCIAGVKAGVGACPPLPELPAGSRKLAICEQGQPVEWFGGDSYIPAIRAEVARRLAARRNLRPRGEKPASLPAVDDFEGQAALLDSLVPSGLVRDAGEALLLRPVKLIGPARRGRNFVPLSLKSESEALGEDESLTSLVSVASEKIEFATFIADLGTVWVPYTGPLSLEIIDRLGVLLDKRKKHEHTLDDFRTGFFGGRTIYWVESRGRLVAGPITAAGNEAPIEAARAFSRARTTMSGGDLPDAWTLAEAVAVALPSADRKEATRIAWHPGEDVFRSRVGSGEWKPVEVKPRADGSMPASADVLRWHIEGVARNGPRGSTVIVKGAWLGRLFPSDFGRSVVFEAPLGGSLSLDDLRAAISETTAEMGEIAVDRELERKRRRVEWARRWIADQGKEARGKRETPVLMSASRVASVGEVVSEAEASAAASAGASELAPERAPTRRKSKGSTSSEVEAASSEAAPTRRRKPKSSASEVAASEAPTSEAAPTSEVAASEPATSKPATTSEAAIELTRAESKAALELAQAEIVVELAAAEIATPELAAAELAQAELAQAELAQAVRAAATASKPTRTPKPRRATRSTPAPVISAAALGLTTSTPCTACADSAKPCTACAHASDSTVPSKESEAMKDVPETTTTRPRAPKKSSKKVGRKKATSKKAASKPAASKPAETPKRTKKAAAAKPPAASSSSPAAAPAKRGPGRPRKTPAPTPAAETTSTPAATSSSEAASRPRRVFRRNDMVRFRKRSRIASDLKISESQTFRVEYGLVIEGERYVMIRLGKSNAMLPVPEGQLVAVERAEELPLELRGCLIQLGRYKGKLRPQVRHFLRELQRRA